MDYFQSYIVMYRSRADSESVLNEKFAEIASWSCLKDALIRA